MNVRNCKKCGRIFNYVMGPIICPRCKEGMEVKFQEVKTYVREHQGADIKEVSEECQVETSQIRQWIREERLQFSDDSPIRIPCESCGAMIQTGRFCDKCKMEMANEFKQTVESGKPKAPAQKSHKSDGDKMRFLK